MSDDFDFGAWDLAFVLESIAGCLNSILRVLRVGVLVLVLILITLVLEAV